MSVARVKLLQEETVVELFTSKLEENHDGYSGIASLIGSSIADLAKESQEVKVKKRNSRRRITKRS